MVVKRKSELSLLNIGMCLAVIFIHIASWTLPSMDKASVKFVGLMVPWRLSAFVVQGFLFLSGVKLFASQKPFHYGKFLFGRLKTILLPYLLWVCAYYAYFIAIGWYKFSMRDLVEYIFLGTLCSHFYFIVTIVQFYLLLPLFRWLLQHVNVWLLCGGAVLLTVLFKLCVHFPYDDRVFPAYLCYFVIGAAVGKHYDAVLARLRRLLLPLGISLATLGFFDALFTYRAQVKGATYPYFEALHLGYCLSAIFFWTALLAKAAQSKPLPRLLALCDRSSYGMYLSHVLFIYIANDLLYRAGITDLLYTFALRGIFTYAATLICCMAYTLIREKLHDRP